MNVKTEWLGCRRFRAIGPSGVEVTMDAGREYGGDGGGNSPMELLLMGLAGCMGTVVTNILEKKRMILERFELELKGEREKLYPRGFTHVEVIFHIEGSIDPDAIWKAIQLSEHTYCSVSASLKAKFIPKLFLNGELYVENN